MIHAPSKPIRRTLRAAPAALAALLLLAGCGRPDAEAAKPAAPAAQVEHETVVFASTSPQLAALRVAPVARERGDVVRINGRVAWDARRTARVDLPVSGRVTAIRVTQGDRVARGALLAVVSSPDFGQAQAEARRADADLLLAERSLRRARELHAAGVTALKDLQTAEAEQARAKAEQARTAARERSFGNGARIDQLYRVTAPIDGVVVDRHIAIGQEVRPEQPSDAPLFLITDPTRLWVQLEIPESLSGAVSVGDSLQFTTSATPNERYTGQVEYVADFVDNDTRMIGARASVDNAERRLKGGMYVTAEVSVPPTNAVRVPTDAIFLLEDGHHVFVEEAPARFVRRRVEAEAASLGMMRVTQGLSAGDRVVTDGALLLQQMLELRSSSPQSGEGRQRARPQ